MAAECITDRCCFLTASITGTTASSPTYRLQQTSELYNLRLVRMSSAYKHVVCVIDYTERERRNVSELMNGSEQLLDRHV